ncbi:MAG: hypothetical protein CVU10_02180 [Bacteroidetes bacterium HGW-Bacteroidetes-5]|jgi:opacity protein-like surface antigen|nr:MAG: hypothetical protein CVU10_02180 [Bacteroidetes bacterium HGW-Bacteroidetes-5]
MKYFISLLLFLASFYSQARCESFPKDSARLDKRGQLPGFMHNSYFEVSVGSINYPFSERLLEPGFQISSITVRHPAVRLVLLGTDINRYIAAQVTYMRPVWWVNYKYRESGEAAATLYSRSVWMNIAGVVIKAKLPISSRVTLYSEGGLAVITRHGITHDNGSVVVKDMVAATTTFGAGAYYNLSDKWALQMAANYTSSIKKHTQPYTTYVGVGGKYSFRPFSEEKMQKAAHSGRIHPKQWVQIGVSTNLFGYNTNDILRKSYLFWGGGSEIRNGFIISYKRNIFHSPKVFAMDFGVNAAYWNTNKNREKFFGISVFPVFRINFLQNKLMDPYFFYTLGGPAFISRSLLDGIDTGKRFTFYDAIGLGAFLGVDRRFNAEVKVAHYSNGNIFPENAGVKIPLTFCLGFCF